MYTTTGYREFAICDACGQDVPVSEIAPVYHRALDEHWDICERCRGIPAKQDPADHHLEQLNEMRLERERLERECRDLEPDMEDTEGELDTPEATS